MNTLGVARPVLRLFQFVRDRSAAGRFAMSRPVVGMMGLVLVTFSAVPMVSEAHGYGNHRHHVRSFLSIGHSGHYGHRHHRRHHRYRRHFGPFYDPFYDGYPAGGSFSFFGSNHHSGFSITVPIESYSTPTRVYEREVVRLPDERVRAPAPAPAQPALPQGCTQTREFRTNIIIGGETVPAYGTACLMPDGTWRQLGLNYAPN